MSHHASITQRLSLVSSQNSSRVFGGRSALFARGFMHSCSLYLCKQTRVIIIFRVRLMKITDFKEKAQLIQYKFRRTQTILSLNLSDILFFFFQHILNDYVTMFHRIVSSIVQFKRADDTYCSTWHRP